MISVCKYLWRQRTEGLYLPLLRLLPENNRCTLACVTEVHSADIQMSVMGHKMAAIEVCVCRFSRGLSMNHEELYSRPILVFSPKP